MFLVCYLAHDDTHITAVQERLSLAQPPMVLVTARSLPELINQVQTLPVRVVLVDLIWPRATWAQLAANLHQTHPALPLLALTPKETDEEWWLYAHDLLSLDSRLEPFTHRLLRAVRSSPQETAEAAYPASSSISPAAIPMAASLLEHPQFTQFAEVFAGVEEAELLDGFVAWVQQACQTSRAVLLLRDATTGNFLCRAQRGLPSTLIPHCMFSQTAPICHWLTTTGRILLKEAGVPAVSEVESGLDLMQAVAAVPVMNDGQLVGILGVGARLLGQDYHAAELKALFALGEQLAMAVHHCRLHQELRGQQEITEHLLGVMPTGTLVLGEDQRIAFVNAAAAAMLGKTRAQMHGVDLRGLPSPLGDLAYEALIHREDLARRECTLAPSGRQVAVTGFALATTPPTAMLLIEDLSAQKRLAEEHERRVDLEVVTNLVHYLAHELRNPLVTLSTFSNLAPSRAGDPDFQEFCQTVLQSEINRINLILEQLLVLTHHAEFQFDYVSLGTLFARITGAEEMHDMVSAEIPATLPQFFGDGHRLETAFTCILRTLTRLAHPPTKVSLRVEAMPDAVTTVIAAPVASGPSLAWLLNPWDQFLEKSEEHLDLGLATAKHILEQHDGSLTMTHESANLTIICRLPLRTDLGGEKHDAEARAHR